jgi:alpha-L-arabinofuranosidase
MSKITVKTSEKRFPVTPDLYGLFFEDINRAGDSGLYPEMLRNRSFEDSIPPERCTVSDGNANFKTPLGWSDQFNNGEGLAHWSKGIPETKIPAWYADNAEMSLDESDTLNKNRIVSLKVGFAAGGSVKNIGYHGVPLKKGEKYNFYMFAKAAEAAEIKVAVASASGAVLDEAAFTVKPGGYERFDCSFTAAKDDFSAILLITSKAAATVNFGFMSLMPADTYKGHGMRKDLMEMLAGTNSKFLRFPGGCIVEGFTYETAIRFPNTIGPVWERPTHVLMWHYRTTNGLGYHEYLQICEDLNIEPMYVVNCGLTCQARAPELFVGEELDALLKETLDSVEYAIGSASTPMGKKRAAAGHPEPFKLTYIEIGNENWGPEYFSRYKMFYDALKAKYPKIKYISNTHTEREGLPTEIADEHYYNTPEFFAENTHKFDDYDRHGPDIFIGEYAVNSGTKPGTLRNALGEAMFLSGVENNQDIVTLTAYAPLFENVNFSAWKPDLIAFDNHRSYGIATYHALGMLAGNRGRDVVGFSVETDSLCRDVSGIPGIMAAKSGMILKNVKLNGKPVSISREIQGSFTQNGEEFTSVSDPSAKTRYLRPGMEKQGDVVWATFGENAEKLYEFEFEAKSASDNPITIAVWCHRPLSYFNIDETAANLWDTRSVRHMDWILNGTSSVLAEGNFFRRASLAEDAAVSVNLGEYNTYKVVTRSDGFDCYINGKLVHKAYIPKHPALAVTASTDDDNVIVKITNINSNPDDIQLSLDCPVKAEYEVQLLASDDPDAANSLENPTAVSAVTKTLDGASQNFTYKAPAYSLSILKLKKA